MERLTQRRRSGRVGFFAAILVLAGLLLLFFNRMALSNLILARGDTFLYFYPYWYAAAQSLRDLQVPFWNPAIFMGAPLLANSQAGFFYPLNWPLWALLEPPVAVKAAVLLHILIAAVGSYLAGRRALFLPPPAALLTAASFAYGGYLTAQVEHVNQLQGLAWMPWFLVALERGAPFGGQARWRAILLVALLFTMQLLAGHTQTTFITAVALLIWITAGHLQTRLFAGDGKTVGERPSAAFSLVAVIGGGLLALGLAAVQLAPTLELTRLSSREGGLPVNEALSFSLPPHLLTQSLLPAYGRSLFTEYVAFLPLIVLALAFIGAWHWRRPGALQALSLALGGLFLALGAYNPLYWLLVRLPGFSFFRAPARWLVLYALGVSLLAGLGWHLLWVWMGAGGRGAANGRRQFGRPLILFLFVIALLVLWGFAGGILEKVVPLGPEASFAPPSPWMVGGWLAELLLLAAVLLTARARWSGGGARLPLLLLPLGALAAGYLASRPLPYNNLTTPEAFSDIRPATARLMAESGADPPGRLLSLSDIFFDPGDQGETASIYAGQLSPEALYDYTVAIKQKEINAPNWPMVAGLASVDGFDGGILPLRAYSQVVRVLLPPGEETTDGRLSEYLDAVPPAAWLDLFNARYILTDKTGDEWRDGVYYDRQHAIDLTAEGGATVSALPDYEATELRLIAGGRPGPLLIETSEGQIWRLEAQTEKDNLFRVPFPAPARLTTLAIEPCQDANPCVLEALTLVDTRDDTFQALVPGNYRLIHSGDVKIYENSDVLPRAFLIDSWRVASTAEEALDMMIAPDFDPRKTAVIEAPEAPPFNAAPVETAETGRVEIETYEPHQITLRTASERDRLLVLTDAFYPGWTAAIDGQAVPIYRAYGLFRSVFVPAGQHQVTFQFNSPSYRAGLIFFLCAMLIILLGLLRFTAYQRKNR